MFINTVWSYSQRSDPRLGSHCFVLCFCPGALNSTHLKSQGIQGFTPDFPKTKRTGPQCTTNTFLIIRTTLSERVLKSALNVECRAHSFPQCFLSPDCKDVDLMFACIVTVASRCGRSRLTGAAETTRLMVRTAAGPR